MKQYNKVAMEFELNEVKWSVIETSHIESDNDILTLGETHYGESIIYIQENKTDIMIRTLTHELLHAWLFEYGYDQDKKFTNEDLCNIISASYSFIKENTEKYKKLKA